MTTHNEAYQGWLHLVEARLSDIEKPASISDFHLITAGGDRHGALEWTYYSQDAGGDGMDRLVSIAVVPHVPWRAGTFEFWFGGRSGDRFIRRLASSLQVPFDDPD